MWESRASQRASLRNGARPDFVLKNIHHPEPEGASPTSAELSCDKEPWLSQSPEEERQLHLHSFLFVQHLVILRLTSTPLT